MEVRKYKKVSRNNFWDVFYKEGWPDCTGTGTNGRRGNSVLKHPSFHEGQMRA